MRAARAIAIPSIVGAMSAREKSHQIGTAANKKYQVAVLAIKYARSSCSSIPLWYNIHTAINEIKYITDPIIAIFFDIDDDEKSKGCLEFSANIPVECINHAVTNPSVADTINELQYSF